MGFFNIVLYGGTVMFVVFVVWKVAPKCAKPVECPAFWGGGNGGSLNSTDGQGVYRGDPSSAEIEAVYAEI